MKTTARPYSPARSRQVLDALALLGIVAPSVADLARELHWPPAEVRSVVAELARQGRAEAWTEAGEMRVLLSAAEARRRGLTLDRRGQAWTRRPAG